MTNKNTTDSSLTKKRLDNPNQPVGTFLQEAHNLYLWSLNDTKELNLVGITNETIEELPQRTKACREAHALWSNYRKTSNTTEKRWEMQAPQAIELRTELLRAMRFAFRKVPNLQKALSEISKGTGFADLIQDLSNLAVLGEKNKELLTKINFNLSLLDTAAQKSKEIATLYAQVKATEYDYANHKNNRNMAFWHLLDLVNEIRIAGKYVFRNNKSRYVGYTSAYWKQKNNRKSKNKK